MDNRKNDTERVINLLKLYKGRLNKPDEKSLKKVMETLIEGLKSPLYNALIDIQEFYEYSLTNPVPSGHQSNGQTKENVIEEPQASSSTVLREKPKQSKRQHTIERSHDEVTKIITTTQYSVEELPIEPAYRYEQSLEEAPQFILPPQDDFEDDQENFIFFDVLLHKGKKGYGFAIAGGFDKNHYEDDSSIYITKLIPGGAAASNGLLRIGDAIVSVNDTNLDYVIHQTAVETLKNAGKSMAMVIRRPKEETYDNNDTNLDDDYQRDKDEEPLDLYNPPQEQPAEYEVSDDDHFQQFEVLLSKKPGAGLGLSIQGGHDIDCPEESTFVSISRLTPGGVAEVDGRLQLGDYLLTVNDQSLNGLTHDECVSLLKNTGRNVKLFVGRFFEVLPEEQEPAKPSIPEQPIVEKTERRKKKKHRHDRNED